MPGKGVTMPDWKLDIDDGHLVVRLGEAGWPVQIWPLPEGVADVYFPKEMPPKTRVALCEELSRLWAAQAERERRR